MSIYIMEHYTRLRLSESLSTQFHYKTSCWEKNSQQCSKWHQDKRTNLTALCPGLPWWAGNRKVKPIWISLKQERVSGSGISWVICKSAHRSRQITTPAPHHSVFYRPNVLPAAQPTAPKHGRPKTTKILLQHQCWIVTRDPHYCWLIHQTSSNIKRMLVVVSHKKI